MKNPNDPTKRYKVVDFDMTDAGFRIVLYDVRERLLYRFTGTDVEILRLPGRRRQMEIEEEK